MDIDARKHPPRLDWSESRSTVTIERETLERALEGLDAGHQFGCYNDLCDELRAALAAQPAEPNMRHPKIQALIGGKARAEIELGLVEQLLEDPNFETTPMDMEHWGPLHDKLKAALTAQPAEPVAHEFQDRNGKWCPFIDDQHYRNTVKDGSWPIRALYAAPAAVPLTDEQIGALWDDHVVPVFGKNGINPIVFARAVLAAAGEKT